MMLPEPYYQDDQCTIYCGDAFDILPLLDPELIDLVLTDPDYNGKDIGFYEKSYADQEGKKIKLPDDEYLAWCQRWFYLCSQLTDRINLSPGLQNAWNYGSPRWALSWNKPGAVSYNFTGGFNIWEPILLFGKCPRVIQDAYTSTPNNFTREPWKKHPCPKHPGFWRWVLSSVGRHGETVLDPFLGSGTTARVAKDLGLKCIGIERVESYCAMAVDRLAQVSLIELDHPSAQGEQAELF